MREAADNHRPIDGQEMISHLLAGAEGDLGLGHRQEGVVEGVAVEEIGEAEMGGEMELPLDPAAIGQGEHDRDGVGFRVLIERIGIIGRGTAGHNHPLFLVGYGGSPRSLQAARGRMAYYIINLI